MPVTSLGQTGPRPPEGTKNAAHTLNFPKSCKTSRFRQHIKGLGVFGYHLRTAPRDRTINEIIAKHWGNGWSRCRSRPRAHWCQHQWRAACDLYRARHLTTSTGYRCRHNSQSNPRSAANALAALGVARAVQNPRYLKIRKVNAMIRDYATSGSRGMAA